MKFKTMVASFLTFIMVTNNTIIAPAKKSSDSFGDYSDQSAQFKSDTSHLEYADILSSLQASRNSTQVTDLGTIFKNRVDFSKLPDTSEGADQSGNSTASNLKNNGAKISADPSNIVQTPGEFQGSWGGKTTEEIYNTVNFEGGGKVSQSDFKKLMSWSGQTKYFDERNNYVIPVPHYTQAEGVEDWYYYYTGDFNLGAAGCCIYMVAHICTVLQGALINPAEAYILCRQYGIVNSVGLFNGDSAEAGFNALMELNGYKCKFYHKSEVDENVKQELIDSLQRGIPCGIWETRGPLSGSGSHFQNIDYYDSRTGEFTIAQATRKALDTNSYSWETIYNGFISDNSRPCLYIIY